MAAIYERHVQYDSTHDLCISYGVEMDGDKVDYFVVHGIEVLAVQEVRPRDAGTAYTYRIHGNRFRLMDEVEFLVREDLVKTVSYGLEPTAKLERILRREI